MEVNEKCDVYSFRVVTLKVIMATVKCLKQLVHSPNSSFSIRRLARFSTPKALTVTCQDSNCKLLPRI
ncbi:hypothetical protein FNV43_RR00255 [Rhamnella rubrinervis]|uniref:Uncharacterized protein n=1 Tax=Rhamnella rubrinervis TaxID=2594499 RepID=A0A8K0HNU1_9ROSA|nr:hypothetical protein FNV43_RR00255 [Rhamnella rubrinervis]